MNMQKSILCDDMLTVDFQGLKRMFWNFKQKSEILESYLEKYVVLYCCFINGKRHRKENSHHYARKAQGLFCV